MSKVFGDFELDGFWDDSEYARKYVCAPLTDATVAAVEEELGYKLPAAYVELMRQQNGGVPTKKCHRLNEPKRFLSRVDVYSIYSIGSETANSLCGRYGNHHWLAEWEYPPIGVYFADTPSAGHDMVCLDYRECGPEGEPQVVHVDQEVDYEITFVAEDFESFIRGLEPAEAFDD